MGSSVARMAIVLRNWVLGRIFGIAEREAESYVKVIFCRDLIVLGDLYKVYEEKGVVELYVESRLCYWNWVKYWKGN